MASMASSLPWLVALSDHKLATFGFTTLVLGYSWWRVHRLREAEACSVADAKRLRFQGWVLSAATGIFGISVFAAYALLPIVMWFDKS